MKTQKLIQKLAEGHKPVHVLPGPEKRFLKWSLWAVVCISLSLWGLGMRGDLSLVWSEPSFYSALVLLVVMTVFSGLSAFFLSVPGRESKTSIIPFFTLLMWFLVIGLSFYQQSQMTITWGGGCVRDILMIATLPAIALFVMISRASILSRAKAGFFAALASVSLGGLGVQLTCGHDEALHLFFWHYIPVLSTAFLGLFLGVLLWRGK